MARTAAPANVRLLHGRSDGTDSGGRPVTPAPSFKRLPPVPPEWLSAEAEAEWLRVVPELTRLQVLKAEDRAALVAYCESWAQFVEATRVVAAEGLTIEAKQGVLPHPAVGIARAAGRELRAWAAHFGLTPSAESALGGDRGKKDAEADNPFI